MHPLQGKRERAILPLVLISLFLIMQSTNPFAVVYFFLEFSKKIHKKASPANPNYIATV